MTALRRGFKAEGERIAACVRRDLDLGEWEPIDPWVLAKHLGYTVIDLRVFEVLHPAEVALLRRYTGPKGFSAATLLLGRDVSPSIILNDGHSLRRRAADLCHELAHGLLLHQYELFNAGGRGKVDEMNEAEASWLGPTLLVPGKAARHIVREGLSVVQAAEVYGVSEQLLEMRLRVTGARKMAQAQQIVPNYIK